MERGGGGVACGAGVNALAPSDALAISGGFLLRGTLPPRGAAPEKVVGLQTENGNRNSIVLREGAWLKRVATQTQTQPHPRHKIRRLVTDISVQNQVLKWRFLNGASLPPQSQNQLGHLADHSTTAYSARLVVNNRTSFSDRV
jgi:hypothetical protein